MTEYDAATAAAVSEAREEFATDSPDRRAVFGFDGYVDRTREAVAQRHDPDSYDRMETLAAYRDRIGDSVAADSSLSIEWLQRSVRAGGHTSHLGRAFSEWGFETALFGMYGDPIRDVFEAELPDADLHSLGEPGSTDALEFDDGKLMLIENGDTTALDWERLCETAGRETLADRLDGAALFGAGYWAETPDLPDVLDGLRDLWADLDDPPEAVLVDPGDVRKLDRERLSAGRDAIGRLADVATVVLSANRAETATLADAMADGATDDQERDAARVAEALSPSLFVSHGTARSVVVSEKGRTSVAVPAVDDPAITTSAGDHFNAGLALALVQGLGPGPAVAVGNAVAGRFVRTGETPTLDAVGDAVESYETLF